jgi:2-polyprenyl-3-methyl-5-hydroxy-6-metoxy-1,4-benzoquinol methylase
MPEQRDEKATWDSVKEMLGDHSVKLSKHWSFNLRNDPKRLAFVLARYKFAARLGTKGRSVLELGCSEGMGAVILAEAATRYAGVDLDDDAIATAKANWTDPKFEFHLEDFLSKPQPYGAFDTVVSLDVIEHIEADVDERFFEAIVRNLGPQGMAIVGTPNITSVPYASPASQAGHVNMFSAERLAERMREHFVNVFSFGMNDEVLHTGYSPMCHYIFAVGCTKRLQKGGPK